MDLEDEAGASVQAADEDVKLVERLTRKPTSIFGFRSMLVQQPAFPTTSSQQQSRFKQQPRI